MARYSGLEKRQHKRLTITLPTKYKFGTGGSMHHAQTIDISEGGIFLGPVPISAEWMLKNCEIELEIVFPYHRRHVRALAEVVRVEGSKRPHHIHHRRRHNIRLKFCEISDEDRKTIDEFVKKKGGK